MKRFILFLTAVLLSGCEFYIEERPRYHSSSYVVYEYEQYCDESQPYWESPNEYHQYYDYYGYYEGACGIWQVSPYQWEEWCNWEDQCGWEYVSSWYY